MRAARNREAWLPTWPALQRPLLPLLRYPRAKCFANGGWHVALCQCLYLSGPRLGGIHTLLRGGRDQGSLSALRGHGWKAAICRWGGRPHQTPALWAPWSWTSSPQNQEKNNKARLFKPPVDGVLLWQPQQTRTRNCIIQSLEEPRRKETQRLREGGTPPQAPQPGAGRQM